MKGKERAKKIVSLFMTVLLVISSTVPFMSNTAWGADYTVTSSEYLGGSPYGGGNTNARAEINGGELHALCAEPAKDVAAPGTSVTLSEADDTIRGLCWFASQTTDLAELWRIHHAAAEHLGLNNAGMDDGIRQYLADAPNASVPDNFLTYVGTPADGGQTMIVWGTKPQGTLSLTKTSSKPEITSGNVCYSLEGAVYGVYTSEGNADADVLRVATMTTDASGYAAAITIDNGTYYLKEVTAPRGMALNTMVYTATVSSGSNTDVAVTDAPISDPISVALHKTATVNGEVVSVTDGSLAGAEYTFRYYAGQYATAAEADASGALTRTWVYRTDADGYINFSDESYKVGGDALYYSNGVPTVPVGTVTIQETKAPSNFMLDPTFYIRNITPDGTGSETVDTFNVPTVPEVMRGALTVTKTSEDGQVSGITFTITGLSGYSQTATTDASGKINLTQLEPGTYTVTESTPNIYVAQNAQTVTVGSGQTATVTFANVLKKWNITVTKQDTETNGAAQGNATLAGAVYGIYKGGTLMDSYTTNAAGQFTTKNYACGTGWTVAEITPSTGYLLDTNTYTVGLAAGSASLALTPTSKTVSEQIMKGNIQIVKHTNHGLTQIETPEVGATFDIYLTSAGSYATAKATERAQITINKDGFGKTGDLPYGTYTVHQTSGWEGSALMTDFQVAINENGKTYSYIINNERFYSYLKVVKTDAITGTAIPAAGVGFQIYDPQGELVTFWGVDTWYSDNTGTVKIPVQLEYGKGYTAVETNAPAGYVLADKPFVFDVTADAAHQEDGLTVVTLEAKNTPTQVSIAKVDYLGNNVAGADLQLLDANGMIVEKWTTMSEAHIIYRLPIGSSYTLHETAAPEGWMLADDMTVTVGDTDQVQAISMVDEQIPEIYTTATVDGSHEALDTDKITLVDTVAYSKLIPSKDYIVTGTLMDAATGEAVLDAQGNPITASTTFTAAAADGSIDVAFVFDATGLARHSVVAFETLTKDGKTYATHADLTDEGQTVHFPAIDTTATVGGSHEALATDKVTLIDAVAYTNLTVGQEYTVIGVLMDQATGKAVLDAQGNPVTASTTFTAAAADGSIDVAFVFDATGFAGHSVVAFETLTKDGKTYATHADLTDEGQTVHFPEIGTTATVDGNHEALATEKVTLVDTVAYTNLTVGQEYTVIGTLMDQATGKTVLDAQGKSVTASTTFTAAAADGSVDVAFVFDAAGLAGHSVVAFETLARDGKTYATHADLTDKGQTVKFKMPIGTITLKDLPTLQRFQRLRPGVQTGDAANMILWLALGGAALASAGVLFRSTRKNTKRDENE
ncbi:MAG: VaFE repeat-containing surface-anchored protein [Oscillibacter sp.]|nr:VaFE repeat-containing surface-anchored protein [Oscillibacter sp.]